MATLWPVAGVTLADCKLEYPPLGGTYDLKAALTAGGGIVTVTNEGLLAQLRRLTYGAAGTPLLEDVPAYSAAVLADAPALYWRLNETSGTAAADTSGNGRTGTLLGGVTLGVTGPKTIDPLLAVDLDGSNDRVTSTYKPFVLGSVRTFEGWFYRDTTANHHCIIGSDNATNRNFQLFGLSGSTTMRFEIDATSGATVTWAGAASTGAWKHFVLIVDDNANTVELFIDGATQGGPKAIGSVGYHADAIAANLKVGSRQAATDWIFDGKIAAFAVYTSALSGARIAAHYAAAV